MPFRFIKVILILLLTTGTHSAARAQALGDWKSYLNYDNGQYLAEVGSRIYCATPNGLYYFDRSDNSMRGLSKVDGFSDVTIKTIGYNAAYGMLFIAYQDGNIDLVNKGKIININSFRNSNLPGVKEVYKFDFFDKTCYMSTSAGVIEYRMDRLLFGESLRNIDPSCEQIAFYGTTVNDGYLYAASDRGVIRNRLNGNSLNDCDSWKTTIPNGCRDLVTFAGKVFGRFNDNKLRYYNGTTWTELHDLKKAFKSLTLNHGKLVAANDSIVLTFKEDLSYESFGSAQQNHVIMTEDGTYWLAKDQYGMIAQKENNLAFLKPGGPASRNILQMYSFKGQTWFTSGGFSDQGAPNYLYAPANLKLADDWYRIEPPTVPGMAGALDLTEVVRDTGDGTIWIASLTNGLQQLDPRATKVLNVYNSSNIPFDNVKDAISGLSFDGARNLWMTNYRASFPILVRIADKTWRRLELKGSTLNEFRDIIVDNNGLAWLRVNKSLVVYNCNNTLGNASDDSYKILGTASGSGGLPGDEYYAMAKDRTGQMWIATNAGVVVFPESTLLFSKNSNYDGQKPWVKSGDQSGYLLSTQQVTAIAVDGANRKWFGTRSGAWLTTPEGDKILAHYTTENSPLPSDVIRAITVNGETGDVYFSTDKGLISVRGDATEGGATHGDVYAYPNPVRPGYEGPIVIKGLVRDANIKITDVTGNLVYETTAAGGTATWNGKNFSGEDAHSGVYIVFSTNADGSETATTKIMIIR